MVPVKFSDSCPYYKQKTGLVMKNILLICAILFCSSARAASDYNFGGAGYLNSAVDAWSSVFGGVGTPADVAAYMNTPPVTNSEIARFLNFVSVLGYNDTSLRIYATTQHLNQAFAPVSRPLAPRAVGSMVVDVDGFGAWEKFDSDKNDNFQTDITGISVRARGYATNGFSFGVGYTRTDTDTRHTPVDLSGNGNSVTMFAQYMAPGGVFANLGLNGGRTDWTSDKSSSGIAGDSSFDTEFYAGQFNTGVHISRGRFSMAPQMGVRYMRMKSDRYIDSAAQQFRKWWYNALTATAGAQIGFGFAMGEFSLRPSMHVGASYDAISNGTNVASVRVISGETYDIPINNPPRTAWNAGLGLDINGDLISGGVNYRLDMRSDYTAHTVIANVRVIF